MEKISALNFINSSSLMPCGCICCISFKFRFKNKADVLHYVVISLSHYGQNPPFLGYCLSSLKSFRQLKQCE